MGSVRATECISGRPIVPVKVILQLCEGQVNHANKICATGHRGAGRAHGIALREIICYHQYFSKILKAVRGTFNQVICGLAAAGK